MSDGQSRVSRYSLNPQMQCGTIRGLRGDSGPVTGAGKTDRCVQRQQSSCHCKSAPASTGTANGGLVFVPTAIFLTSEQPKFGPKIFCDKEISGKPKTWPLAQRGRKGRAKQSVSYDPISCSLRLFRCQGSMLDAAQGSQSGPSRVRRLVCRGPSEPSTLCLR